MANPAFMEGIAAAKEGKSLKDNPYRDGLYFILWPENAHLWEIGFIFELERQCAS